MVGQVIRLEEQFMDKSRIRRRSKGQGILETVAGCLVIIPIALFGVRHVPLRTTM